MTDLPYTDGDLRAEAARQHAEATSDPDEGLVGELMERGYIPSVETGEDGSARTWPELLEPDGEETPEYWDAQTAVTELIKNAADTSRWAVDLGADGLEPAEHSITIGDTPAVRIHFAFAPGLGAQDRTAFVNAIAHRTGDCDTCAT
mgnify:CR=1 FL=1